MIAEAIIALSRSHVLRTCLWYEPMIAVAIIALSRSHVLTDMLEVIG